MIRKIELNPIGQVYKKGLATNKEVSFKDVIKDVFNKLNQSQLEADKTIKKFLAGEISDIHKVMITLEKANLQLRLALQVRNKLIEAYQEIMRMQI